VTPCRILASLLEVRKKWLLNVEDWAKIRRLHRAAGMPIKAIAGGGLLAEHGAVGVAGGWAAGVREDTDPQRQVPTCPANGGSRLF